MIDERISSARRCAYSLIGAGLHVIRFILTCFRLSDTHRPFFDKILYSLTEYLGHSSSMEVFQNKTLLFRSIID